jgi:hypothetical protein
LEIDWGDLTVVCIGSCFAMSPLTGG